MGLGELQGEQRGCGEQMRPATRHAEQAERATWKLRAEDGSARGEPLGLEETDVASREEERLGWASRGAWPVSQEIREKRPWEQTRRKSMRIAGTRGQRAENFARGHRTSQSSSALGRAAREGKGNARERCCAQRTGSRRDSSGASRRAEDTGTMGSSRGGELGGGNRSAGS